MKRKITKVGPSTLMVSLPSKWVQENHLTKGNELLVSMDGKEISYSLEKKTQKGKEIQLDISKMGAYILSRYWSYLYAAGYSKITFIHKNKEVLFTHGKRYGIRQYISRLVNRSIGAEIVSQTDTKTQIQLFLLDECKDLKVIETRIISLFVEGMDEIIDDLKQENYRSHDEYLAMHDRVVKYIRYYLKMLTLSDTPEPTKSFLFSMYSHWDLAVDKYYYIIELAAKEGCSKRAMKLISQTFSLCRELLYKYGSRVIDQELIFKRLEIIMSFFRSKSVTAQDAKLFVEVKVFLELFVPTYSSLVALDIEKRMNK